MGTIVHIMYEEDIYCDSDIDFFPFASNKIAKGFFPNQVKIQKV